MSDLSTFSEQQGPSVRAAADLVLASVDFGRLLKDAGVDLKGADSIAIEFSTDIEDGVLKKRPGDGKGCVTICVGWGPAKICWKNCDD